MKIKKPSLINYFIEKVNKIKFLISLIILMFFNKKNILKEQLNKALEEREIRERELKGVWEKLRIDKEIEEKGKEQDLNGIWCSLFFIISNFKKALKIEYLFLALKSREGIYALFVDLSSSTIYSFSFLLLLNRIVLFFR